MELKNKYQLDLNETMYTNVEKILTAVPKKRGNPSR